MIWLFQNIGREPAVLRAKVVLIDDGGNAVVVRLWVPVNECHVIKTFTDPDE